MGLLSDILYRKGVSKLGFVSWPLHTLEIFSMNTHDEPLIIESDAPLETDLSSWLRTHPPELRGMRPIGGLRLLYHEWDASEDILSRPLMPFTKDDLDEIISELHLPTSYPYDFENQQPTPTRIEKIETPSGTEIGVVLQSPKLFEDFITLVLSYDPQSNITCGYLGYVATVKERHKPRRWSLLKPILEDLRSAAQYASHPLLLPTLSFRLWCEILRNDLSRVDRELKAVARDTELVKGYFYGMEERDRPVNFEEDVEARHRNMHQKLAEQHLYVTGQTGTFVEVLSDTAMTILTDVEKSIPNGHTVTLEAGRALKTYTQHMQERAKAEMQHKERLLSRLQMQLQILYNLIQQRDSQTNLKIASETVKDSKAMKSISLLTFLFLPGTALATIFAIGPFFTADPTTSKLSVNSDFWIYWAVVLPLTLLLLVLWFLWVQRDWFRKTNSTALSEDPDWESRGRNGRAFENNGIAYVPSPKRESSRHSKR